ncbi:MAG: IS1380 family transposase [Spirochaetales bacterium]|nr:IS1380 family transposase [Spirochaetales bacterium]
MNGSASSIKTRISRIEITDENLTGRAGLCFLSRYIRDTEIVKILEQRFTNLRKSSKGNPLSSVFHQVLCFFINGDNFHLTHFDHLKNDPGYAGVIEVPERRMLSSHSVKIFFGAFRLSQALQLRKILHMLFIWQLKKEKPEKIILGLDTMVMNNDDARKREEVAPTYKKVKGFQPLHLYWGRFIVDTILRNGKAHSNHGNNVQRVLKNAVRLIRKNYSMDVPIILLADAGFFDEKLFILCEELDIGFIVGGKMYQDIKDFVADCPDNRFYEHKIGKRTWYFLDFTDSRKTWNTNWRCIYTKPISDSCGQVLLDFDRPESVIYTNLGMANEITSKILALKNWSVIEPEIMISTYHGRGCDELVNRAFKDFGTEQLPFKRFSSNSAY